MARVERGNVVLHIDDNDIQHYLNLGYNLTDESGNVLQRSIPTNLGELQSAFIANTARIAELEDTVAKLTAELTTLKSGAKNATAKTTPSKPTTPKASK